jgi:FkbM family methyltransferase
VSAGGAAARLRRVGAHPALEPATALALRAGTVRGSAGFVARELLRGRGTRAYELRRNGLTAVIRHGTPDVVTLGEVFHRPDYAFPPPVARVLAGRPAPRVLDLGANIGLFGLFVLGELPAATVEAFEPDPANAAVLRAAIAANGLADRWTAVEAAAGAEDGEVAFDAGHHALSRIDGTGATRVALIDVLPRVARADLVKLDIEGGEWAILGDPRFEAAPPPTVVLEYHPHLAPAGRPPRVAVEERLRACGYELGDIFHRTDGHGMLWGWRP